MPEELPVASEVGRSRLTCDTRIAQHMPACPSCARFGGQVI